MATQSIRQPVLVCGLSLFSDLYLLKMAGRVRYCYGTNFLGAESSYMSPAGAESTLTSLRILAKRAYSNSTLDTGETETLLSRSSCSASAAVSHSGHCVCRKVISSVFIVVSISGCKGPDPRDNSGFGRIRQQFTQPALARRKRIG